MTYSLDPIKSELRLVTPEVAKTLREDAHYERQRPINEIHVKRLATEMAKGRFIAGTQVHICDLNGKLFVVNGNHTLEAVMESKIPVALDLLYTEVKSHAEIAKIYMRHDIGRWRDWAAAIRASGLTEAMHANKSTVNVFGGACLYILCGFAHIGGGGRESPEHNEARTSRDVRIEKMREYQPYAERYFSCIKNANGMLLRRLLSSPVMAVALECFRYHPGKAKEFWSAVANNEGLKRGDPRRTLINYLIEQPSGSNNRVLLPRACAAAWNAQHEGRELQIIRIHTSSPFVLLGTPHTPAKISVEPKFKPLPKVSVPVLKTGVRVGRNGSTGVAMARLGVAR